MYGPYISQRINTNRFTWHMILIIKIDHFYLINHAIHLKALMIIETTW